MEKKKFKLGEYNDFIKDFTEYQPYTMKTAIKAYCKQCCVYQVTEVKQCASKSCPLYPYKERYYNKVRITDQ